MSTSYEQKEQEIGKQMKTVTFENPDQKWAEVEENPEQESLSGEKDVSSQRTEPGTGKFFRGVGF